MHSRPLSIFEAISFGSVNSFKQIDLIISTYWDLALKQTVKQVVTAF